MKTKSPLFLLLFIIYALAAKSQTVLLPFGADWKYLDNGSNQDSVWRTNLYNDSTWKTGRAMLGYGISGANTVLSYGPNASKKFITTYFRKTISVANPSLFASVKGVIRRDDGVVVYVNGKEVYRNRMPSGAITSSTKASSLGDGGAKETAFTIGAAAFVSGTNTIAVEIHQYKETSSDIAFDLQLTPNAKLTRGPYLQMGSETGITVRWRTSIPTDSKVQAGTTYGGYSITAIDTASTTEHIVVLSQLQPGTKYFYRVGSTLQTLQGSTANYFSTAPPADSSVKTKIAVFGDCGRDEGGNRSGSLKAYLNYMGSEAAPIMLLLGDNAYQSGTDAEYQSQFFNPYSGSVLKNHIVFPTPGNHDYYSSNQASRAGAYYQNFSVPTRGECGGLPSGTEAYYSYDWGNIHFISMDSYGTESPDNSRLYDTLGPQVSWLKNDLQANKKPWVIAYWHHPPYTMGSHNSDKEGELIKIRQNFIRILERYGVDLVLTGHSHDYERSYLLDNYYGMEAEFDPTLHTKSSSSGKNDGSLNSTPYITVQGAGNHGTVYVVAGSAGAAGKTQVGYPHNAMPFSFNTGGMLYLEVEANRLDAKFIRKDGVIADQFTILQEAPLLIGPSKIASRSLKKSPGLSVLPTLVKRGGTISIQTKEVLAGPIQVMDVSGRIWETKKGQGTIQISTGHLPAGTYFVKLPGGQAPASWFVVTD